MKTMVDGKKTFAYVGNWNKTGTGGCGFGLCRYIPETGALEPVKILLEEINVGATCLDSKRNILYCTNEVATYPGYLAGGGGQVYALAIDPETGDLTEINHQPSYATLPSYVTVDAEGQYLIVTNHTGATPITRVVRDASGKYRIVLEYDDATTVLHTLNGEG